MSVENGTPWSDDILKRRDDGERIVSFLLGKIEARGQANRPRSCVLNVDAGWGAGKSYFLRNLGLDLRSRGFLVAEVDAWKNDHADDPLIAVMSAVEKEVRGRLPKATKVQNLLGTVVRHGGKIAVGAAKGFAVQATRRWLGDAVDTLGELIATDSSSAEAGGAEAVDAVLDKAASALIEKFESTTASISGFRSNLGKLLTAIADAKDDETRVPLFVLVDELDRCRPPFAIQLLERVKHLFEIEHVVFVVATDTTQLSHAVKAVYGSEFDSLRYLGRFFEQTYVFDPPNLLAFVKQRMASLSIDVSLFSSPGDAGHFDFVTRGFAAAGLTLRDSERCLETLANITAAWSRQARGPIELAALVPLVITNHQSPSPTLDRFKLNRSTMEGWTVTTISGGQPHEVAAYEYFTLFARAAQTSLGNLADTDSRGIPDEWVGGRFRQEWSLRQSVEGLNRKAQSWVASYPQLVRGAGHLRATVDLQR
ncbi:KAP family P-loop NTPase fold protein [Devosia sp.]|uniref:KAP family P-loop NTPase fold protein n=1 Tax=Devosia sp. TaxID=1871048 RepID=UPI003F72DD73